jgi:hypothetical protein
MDFHQETTKMQRYKSSKTDEHNFIGICIILAMSRNNMTRRRDKITNKSRLTRKAQQPASKQMENFDQCSDNSDASSTKNKRWSLACVPQITFERKVTKRDTMKSRNSDFWKQPTVWTVSIQKKLSPFTAIDTIIKQFPAFR